MNNWKMSFKARIVATVAFACFICATVAVAVSMSFNKKALEAGVLDKSRTILDRLDAATDYIAKQGGLNIVVEKFVSKYKSPELLTENDKIEILKQVPIFAAMKIGAKDSEKEHYSFRVFSNEPRRKENMASAVEMEIFKKFENDPKLGEQVFNDGKIITLYQPVRLSEAQGCLTCHGDPANSPWKDGRDVLGIKMENWKDGKLHGVFAITSELAAVAKAQADAGSGSSVAMLALFIGLGSLFAIALAVLFIRGPINNIAQVAAVLSDASVHVNDASQKIAGSSQELSQAATEQAASLEETVASIEEMNAMVGKNSASAESAATTSNHAQTTATRGKEAVERMISSMDDINASNTNIVTQINESNAQISEIVQVIQEIGNKTKVINDIVFQTKLLSFNASVEAARAGEHGKGFAVVAEEVGNLAQMSGTAAKEISDMLESSVRKVNTIVTETKTKVEALVAQGRTTVENGSQIAQECGQVLNEIVENVSSVSNMASDISMASREQALGINEITKAMNQLDQVTQQNAGTSEQTSSASQELSEQANALRDAVLTLSSTLNGSNGPATNEKAVARRDESSLKSNLHQLKPRTKSKKLGSMSDGDWKKASGE